ncbi:MAG: replication initiation protein [Peptostreptococcaceae bacterium]|nr:replication initiation protein [Peptostreptococcaceae bacterium]
MENNNDLKILNKNNLLIKSNYNLNLTQNRFYLTILYNMQKDSDCDNYSCIIKGEEFKKLTKHKKDSTNKGIKDLLDSLRKKTIVLQEIRKDGNKEYYCGIIDKFEWDQKTDTYKIYLDKQIYDLLINYYELNKGYAPLNLLVLIGLNNYYAQRLYELIRMESWKGKNINFTINYLRESFELGDKYSQYTDFRKRVIDQSIKVLNETEKFNITYSENRVGRNVESINFEVEDLETREYFKDKEEVENDKPNDAVEPPDFKNDLIPAGPIANEPSLPKNNSNPNNTGNIEDYIDTSLLERGFLINFKRLYKNVDFSLEYIQDAYYHVVGVIMEKDGVDKLGMTQLGLFKKIFNEVAERKEREDIENFLHELEVHHMEKYLNSK